MKTNQEIESEAQQLSVLGRQYQTEQRGPGRNASADAGPRVLTNLPTNPTTLGPARWVDSTLEADELIFRLMERKDDSAREAGNGDGVLIMASPSAYDVLKTGYELAEEERLAARLEAYVERGEDRIDPADEKTIAEVEAILETERLPYPDRLRTKLETAAFLEGRLEPSVFIAHAVERQCSRVDRNKDLAERHEHHLTIGEP